MVEVTAALSASPEAVWAVVSDFCRTWHPFIAAMDAGHHERGALVRSFTVHGENRVYREQLTWRSDSDRTLGYTHLEGIAGADAYDAMIAVTDGEDGGSVVAWSATVEAAEPRLTQIRTGTKAIFEAGLAALPAVIAAASGTPRVEPRPGSASFSNRLLEGQPRLSLTLTEGSAGPLCLFLHGIGGSRKNWLPQLAAAGNVMRAAALDLRGYGDSVLADHQSTVEDYCDDILRVKKELQADRLVLVGLSYGSWIATSFAMRHPEMLAGLVLSGGCTGMSEAAEQEQEAFRQSRQVPLDAGQTPADFAPSVVDVLAGPNASDEAKAALLESMAAIPSVTYRDALGCFTNPLEQFDFSCLAMPVLMMTGEYDRLAPPSEIRGVARRIHSQARRPDVRYETVADAGHVCNLEQPDAYNRVLLDFLGKLPR